ncbi:chorismate mutase [Pedobacter cryoconitis]|uniref:chorismate mutase n=1 Tax=Pedobacter cryoconitis TaxID=188932 RepID=A0A7W8YNY4_9SPHI|nr:chorismate mutase [Pedobacter cryoconitis]MBB5619136.1 chorismate mutase [Pedobacter cryoconitis]MBB5644431.1 chorismate mutase [Pedobacter cryoconitis]
MKLYSRILFLFSACLLSHSMLFAQQINAKAPDSGLNTLQINRKKIDSLDKKLMELIGERERAVREIGVYKAKNNIPPLQADRFKQVLEKSIITGEKEGLSATFVTEMMNAIHKESLRIEDEIKLNFHGK